MKEYTVILFKSPTCGPCKMFEPQINTAVTEFNTNYPDRKIIFKICDVSTYEGMTEASKYYIKSSGEALLIDSEKNEVLIAWHRPCSSNSLIADLKARLIEA